MYRQGQVLVPWQCVDNTAMIPRQLVLVSEEIETSLKRHMIYRDDSSDKAKSLFHSNASTIPRGYRAALRPLAVGYPGSCYLKLKAIHYRNGTKIPVDGKPAHWHSFNMCNQGTGRIKIFN